MLQQSSSNSASFVIISIVIVNMYSQPYNIRCIPCIGIMSLWLCRFITQLCLTSKVRTDCIAWLLVTHTPSHPFLAIKITHFHHSDPLNFVAIKLTCHMSIYRYLRTDGIAQGNNAFFVSKIKICCIQSLLKMYALIVLSFDSEDDDNNSNSSDNNKLKRT